MTLRLTTRDQISIDGRTFAVIRRLQNGRIHCENIDDGEPLVIADNEILSRWLEGSIKLKFNIRPDSMGQKVEQRLETMRRNFDILNVNAQEEARRRLAYVTRILEMNPPKITKKVIASLIPLIAAKINGRVNVGPPSAGQNDSCRIDFQRKAPSASAVCSWIAYYRRSGRDIRALVSASHRKGNRNPRFHPQVTEIIDQVLSEEYMSLNRKAPKDIWSLVANQISEINVTREANKKLPPPSLKSIYRAIEKLDARDTMAARYGLKKAKQTFDPVFLGPKATYPLERVEVDHTILDLLVIDDTVNLPIGRPTLTIIIDAFTRMPTGWHVGFDPPGSTAVGHALRHAILPKTYIEKRYPDIISDYPVFGVPQTIVSDIGAEFVSDWFSDACNLLGINVQYCPSGTPKNKGKIERFIKTTHKDFIHKIPGSTFSNIIDKGDIKPAETAVITLSDLNHLIHKWIIEVYSMSEHRGMKDVPRRCWDEGVKKHPVPLPPQASDLDAFLSRPDTRTLQRTGIEYAGLRYNSVKLGALLRRYKPGASVHIRIDPNDLSYLYVHDKESDAFFRVESTDPEYTANLTLAQHKVIARYIRNRIDSFINIAQLYKARAHLQKLVSGIFGLRKRTHAKKAALFLQAGNPEEIRHEQDAFLDSGDSFDAPNSVNNKPEIVTDDESSESQIEDSPGQKHPRQKGRGKPKNASGLNPDMTNNLINNEIDLDQEVAISGWDGVS